jgi:hypothetical protein
VAAFELFLRRLRDGERGYGTAVIKRYTMRLLTSQQFQRASTMICACEMLRREDSETLGSEAFRAGLWVGGDFTANRFTDAHRQLDELIEQDQPESPFQLQRCPWCGSGIVPARRTEDRDAYGIVATDTEFKFFCTRSGCPFENYIPVSVVDDDLFLNPPSLLLATIDKFARLAWDDRARAFFGDVDRRPPSLVIQDELHLISGPLGTIAGVYEAALDVLLSRDGERPKIIAATATIRRSRDQARALYGRNVELFPPAGLDARDSYFARLDDSQPGRLYVGVMGQGHTPVTSLVRTAAALAQAPTEVSSISAEAQDGYSTVVLYHNSKRELGKTMTLAQDDIPARIEIIARDQSRMREIKSVEELSANIQGFRVPEVLDRLGASFGSGRHIDILPCTNMISVGVDVKRLALMIIAGQPKTTAEYIQATSRVGRDRVPGLVVTVYSPTKPRDRSHYEDFRAYHESMYYRVEPTSVTPFALPARERTLHAALVILARHTGLLPSNADAMYFRAADPYVQQLISQLTSRMILADPDEGYSTVADLKRVVEEWDSRAHSARAGGAPLHYHAKAGQQFATLLKAYGDPRPDGWKTLNSMRHVDQACSVKIN